MENVTLSKNLGIVYQILQAILKYKDDPNIIIKSFSEPFSFFLFSKVDQKIAFLNTSKFYIRVQETDPHARILKENADYSAEDTYLQINEAITLRSVHIRIFSNRNFPIVGLNTGKYGPMKVFIRTLFMQ